jgi:transcriptional regulator with GAF, ATPase, and Fis domain
LLLEDRMERVAACLRMMAEAKPLEAEIRAGLIEAGVEFRPADPVESEADALLCAGNLDERLAETVRIERCRIQGNILVLSVGPDPPVGASIWRLLREGVSDVLQWKDRRLACQQIRGRLERWSEIRRLTRASCRSLELVGLSAIWRKLVAAIVEAAHFSCTPILLEGESGTGKELLARLAHHSDGSRDGQTPVSDAVTVDCSTILPELSGSELFGHERGAFTGAVSARDGAFALANGGSLFLDEIGELPLALQTHLLRAIQEGTYKRVGGNVWQTSRFRLVCATNRNLEELVKQGKFRMDLYHRIAGWVFTTPSLRNRREDIMPLANHFLRLADGQNVAEGFDPVVSEYLVEREYPGNVRELRQIVLRMANRHVGPGPITIGDLPEDDRPEDGSAPESWPDQELEDSVARAIALGKGLKEIAHAATETAIRFAVRTEQGSLQRAARRLGVTDRALQIRRATGKIS